MKKLTPEQIERIIDENFGFANVKEAMLFMQDEVLRINGVTDNGASEEREFWIGVCEGLDQAKQSPTAGMNLAQRILHVGGRNNAAGYVEFGSVQAVQALVHQVLRDLPKPRATGCPDTMDDMGHFAEVDMPAFLRKQAG